MSVQRVTLLHTGDVVIPTFRQLMKELAPALQVQHLLDDQIVADLSVGANSVRGRLKGLVEVAKHSGSTTVMFSCSSISGFAQSLQDEVGIPVLRVDEAMADEAVSRAHTVGVVATLPTTLEPTKALLEERAALSGRTVAIRPQLVEGAFNAAVAGNRALHDRLVSVAIDELSSNVDVIVLAQASMASAVERAGTAVAVLSSPRSGVSRLVEFVTESG